MALSYPAIICKENGSFWAEFPDLYGCFSDGETLEEVITNASESLSGYIASLIDRGIQVPNPSDPGSIAPEAGLVYIIPFKR